jgi:hypothetical protein
MARLLRREKANRYNKLSFVLFGAAILVGLAGAIGLAGLLLIIAIVLSVMYHIER